MTGSTTCLLLLLLALPSLAVETADEVLVSTDLCSGLWLVELEWSPEGKPPQQLTAVFDTGGSSGFIDPDGLERISGKRIEEGKRVRMEDLSVAGKPFSTFRVQVRDLDHLSRALGRELDVSEPVPIKVVQGLNKARLVEVGRLDEQVAMGPLVLDDPVVALTDDTELLGAQVLQHFVATFDQEKRRVRLEPATLEPIRLASVQGTGAVSGNDAESRSVVYVAAGSPAATAGLRKGDRVTHVDGVSVFELGCREIESEVPESLVYTVERDGERREVAVATAVLVP